MAGPCRDAGIGMGIVAMAVVLLAGCVSSRPFEVGLPEDFVAGRSGSHVVALMHGPPLWVTYSGFHIPGGDVQPRFGPVQRCSDARVRVRLDRDLGDGDGLVTDICQAALRTLDYLDREAGWIDLKVRMYVVADGREAWRRTVAAGLAPRLSLAVPMHEDRHRVLDRVIDVIAHEGSHLVDRALGLERAFAVEGEVQAYRHAMCARLDITGQLHRRGVPILPDVDGGSVSMRRSLDGGLRVLEETAPLFDGKYYIVAGTPAAATIMERCRQGRASTGQGAAGLMPLPVGADRYPDSPMLRRDGY